MVTKKDTDKVSTKVISEVSVEEDMEKKEEEEVLREEIEDCYVLPSIPLTPLSGTVSTTCSRWFKLTVTSYNTFLTVTTCRRQNSTVSQMSPNMFSVYTCHAVVWLCLFTVCFCNRQSQ